MNSPEFLARWRNLFLFGVLSLGLSLRAQDEISIWPKDAPGEKGDIGAEHDTTKPNEGLVAGRRVIRLGNVSHPTMTIHRPAKDKDTGAAVVVCPGGGYHILAMDLEGTEVCDWLNSIGVTGVLLKYRVPARSGQPNYRAPLQDAQRTMSLVRGHAAEWGFDPKRIGILGFSAGGHLSAATSTRFAQREYEPVDEIDQTSCRPDFTILIYPAYLAAKEPAGETTSDIPVTTNTPPAFVVQTQDDGVGVQNAMVYAAALQKVKVPVELHIYPKGGHGYGLRSSNLTVTTWPQRAEEWMKSAGLLNR